MKDRTDTPGLIGIDHPVMSEIVCASTGRGGNLVLSHSVSKSQFDVIIKLLCVGFMVAVTLANFFWRALKRV